MYLNRTYVRKPRLLNKVTLEKLNELLTRHDLILVNDLSGLDTSSLDGCCSSISRKLTTGATLVYDFTIEDVDVMLRNKTSGFLSNCVTIIAEVNSLVGSYDLTRITFKFPTTEYHIVDLTDNTIYTLEGIEPKLVKYIESIFSKPKKANKNLLVKTNKTK